MRLLLSLDTDFAPGSELDLADLVDVYSAPAGPWFRCNMVMSLDGGATGTDGKSGTINSDADHVVFDLLRALSHAVVVGAGTVRTEGYPALAVAEGWVGVRADLGLPTDLPLVVVTRSGDLPPTVRDQPPGQILLALPSDSPGLAVARDELGHEHVLTCGRDELDLVDLTAQLRERGWDRLLTEGGPHLTGSLLGARLLDELCFTITPMTVGGQHPRPVGPDGTPADLTLHSLVEEDGTLIGRWFTS